MLMSAIRQSALRIFGTITGPYRYPIFADRGTLPFTNAAGPGDFHPVVDVENDSQLNRDRLVLMTLP